MNIIHLGAKDCVTGSCHLLQTGPGNINILVDCGKARISTLKKALSKALKDNGIVYIPAFSLGRTQELIYELDRIKTKVPVFIDSPLGLKITKLYAGTTKRNPTGTW